MPERTDRAEVCNRPGCAQGTLSGSELMGQGADIDLGMMGFRQSSSSDRHRHGEIAR